MSKHSQKTSGKALLSSRFRYARRRLFFGRARLYPDHIALFEIGWRGFRRRKIFLRDVERISWRTDSERAANLTLHLHHGDPIRIWVEGAGLWKYRVDERLGKRLSVADDLPGSVPSASAA